MCDAERSAGLWGSTPDGKSSMHEGWASHQGPVSCASRHYSLSIVCPPHASEQQVYKLYIVVICIKFGSLLGPVCDC